LTWLRFKKKESRRLRPGNSRKDIRQARNFDGSDRSSRRKTMLLIATVCFIGLGCGGLGLWLPTLVKNADSRLKKSGNFVVKEIVIEGNYRCRREDIIKALALNFRQLTFAFSLSRAQTRIQALQFVKEATIYRRLPNRLQIVIEECQPKALFYIDKLYMIDGDGRVIGPAPAGEALDFPVISGVSLEEWRQRPQVWQRLLHKAAELLQIWDERGQQWSEKIAQIELDEVCGVTFFTTGRNWEIQLGLDKYSERLDRWRRVLQELGDRASAVKYFDCTGEASVVVGLRPSRTMKGMKAEKYGQN